MLFMSLRESVRCDSYLGFDQTYDLEFTANEPKQRDYKVHPEDVKLDQVSPPGLLGAIGLLTVVTG